MSRHQEAFDFTAHTNVWVPEVARESNAIEAIPSLPSLSLDDFNDDVRESIQARMRFEGIPFALAVARTVQDIVQEERRTAIFRSIQVTQNKIMADLGRIEARTTALKSRLDEWKAQSPQHARHFYRFLQAATITTTTPARVYDILSWATPWPEMPEDVRKLLLSIQRAQHRVASGRYKIHHQGLAIDHESCNRILRIAHMRSEEFWGPTAGYTWGYETAVQIYGVQAIVLPNFPEPGFTELTEYFAACIIIRKVRYGLVIEELRTHGLNAPARQPALS